MISELELRKKWLEQEVAIMRLLEEIDRLEKEIAKIKRQRLNSRFY